MVEGITAVTDRITAIYDRIEEIKALGSLKLSTTTTTTEESEDGTSTFSQILAEVLGDSAKGMTAQNLSDGLKLNELGALLDVSDEMDLDYSSIYSSLSSKLTTATDLDSIISSAAKTYGVDEELIRAVIQQESSYKTNAVSPVGAEGLMQLMPATAELLGVTDSFDPAQNVFGGTKYLARLLDYYDFDLIKSLAAYNAGTTAVDKAGGVPNYAETQNYVLKVLQNYKANLGSAE